MATDNNRGEDSITIGGEEIPVINCTLPQAELSFYTENPRIYSIVRVGGEEPSQLEIENRLKGMEHVRELMSSIRKNRGLIDPLLVRNDDYVVLEGNSRLAAYRLLASNDPIQWGQVKVRLLPSDLDESKIFALLGEYHIIGRKDWAPFEQAGYLYRRVEKHEVSPASISEQLGISVSRVNKLVEVYRFMLKHDENDVDRWSYYEEYLRPRKNKEVREANPDLDNVVVQKVKSGEIEKAIDIRDKLNKIIKAGPRSINILMSGEQTFERAYNSAIDRGVDNTLLNYFKRFKEKVADESTLADLEVMQDDQRKRCLYELRKIVQRADQIQKKLG